MYSSKFLAITGLVAVLFVPATAPRSFAQTSSVAVSDSTLKDRVETAIKAQPTLKNQAIDINVTDKVVTLTGYVQTSARKTSAARAARVAGVTKVDNLLVVDVKKGKDLDDKMMDATKTAGRKTEETAKVVGEKTKDVAVATKDAAVATGANITDAAINTMIHTKMLNEDTLKGSDINVDVNNHVVTLKGTVASAAGKARVEEIARTTDGVRSVNNTLMIGPKR